VEYSLSTLNTYVAKWISSWSMHIDVGYLLGRMIFLGGFLDFLEEEIEP